MNLDEFMLCNESMYNALMGLYFVKLEFFKLETIFI